MLVRKMCSVLFRLAAVSIVAAGLPTPTVAQCRGAVELVYLDAGTTAPELRTPKGAPVLGGDFAFRIESGAPNVNGLLLVSPFEDPTLSPLLGAIIWPKMPWSLVHFHTSASGSSGLVLNTPDITSALCGEFATFQAVLFDPNAPGGLAVSNAVRMRVGGPYGQLFPGTEVNVGRPVAILAGDFSDDRLDDLLVADEVSDDILVCRSRRDGGFDVVDSLSAISVTDMALFDLEGDGDPDLFATRFDADVVRVYKQDSPGTFSFGGTGYVDDGPIALAIEDLETDGDGDIVTVNSTAQTVSVTPRNGGFFFPTTNYPTGGVPKDVAAGDFDADGAPDIAVVVDLLIAVRLGNGDTTFGGPTDFAAAGGPRSLTLADLDSNGALDLLVALFSDELGVLLGNGDGTFASQTAYAVGTDPTSVAAADVDADGDPDVAVANMGSQDVHVLLGNGDGTLAPPTVYESSEALRGIVIADVEDDGVLDIATVGAGVSLTNGTLCILPGRGDGSFVTRISYPTGLWPRFLAKGDVNGDGEVDFTTSNVDSNDVSVLLGDGTFALSPGTTFVPSPSPGDIELADFDGDGALDALVTDATLDAVVVSRGNGDGTFVPATSSKGAPDPAQLEIADFNGDGVLDVAAAGGFGPTTVVLFGTGNGGFQANVQSFSNAGPAVAADLDADGFADLVMSEKTPGFQIAYSQSNGTLGAVVHYPATNSGRIRAADMNSDGTLDLVTTGDSLSIHLGSTIPGVEFAFSVTYPPPLPFAGEIRGHELADMNGDGNVDVVGHWVKHPTTPSGVGVMLGTGFGTLMTPRLEFHVGDNPDAMLPVDLDRDGIFDVVITDRLEHTLSVLENLLGQ